MCKFVEQWFFGSDSGGNDRKVKLRMNLLGQSREAFERPAFPFVPGGRNQDGNVIGVGAVVGEDAFDRIGSGLVLGDYELRLPVGDAEGFDYFEVVVNHVDAVVVLGDSLAVKEVGELSGVCHAEAVLAAGQAGKDGGSEQALQVDDGVELAFAKVADKIEQRRKSILTAPCFAKEFAVE